MRIRWIYAAVIGGLVILSSVLYLIDGRGNEVVVETAEAKEITVEDVRESLIVVYVTGAVLEPDIYEVKEDSRLHEVIDMAGGFVDEANQAGLNLARFVFDGEQIHVPYMPEEGAQVGGIIPGVDKISINQADLEALMTLSGIGESKARAIIAYRETNGPFKRLEDIMNVAGIKEAMFNKIKDEISI